MTARVRRRGVLVAGSVVAAALSSACCWVPLLAVGFGISTLGLGAAFAANRWLLLAVSVGLLVGVLVRERRAAKACTAAACSHQPDRRPWFVISMLLLLTAAFLPELLAVREPGGVADERGLVRTYAVDGMSCESCAGLLVANLEDQPEIASTTVDYASKSTRVVFEPGITVPRADAVMARVADEWSGEYQFRPR